MDYLYYDAVETAKNAVRSAVCSAVEAAAAAGTLPGTDAPDFVVEIPADTKNGDFSTNVALAGARTWRMAPPKIAAALLEQLRAGLEAQPLFDRVECAGPGFLNFYLAPEYYTRVLRAALQDGEAYGRTRTFAGQKVNVEFVSANPTGPMHLGNARGGALGDCLAACMDWAGYDVTREFYVNDAGNQIQKFGRSLSARYLQQFKGEEAVAFPEDGYQGEDIKVLAAEFAALHGDTFVQADEEVRKQALIDYALPKNVAGLQADLEKYRIAYDVWFRESVLHESGAIQAVVDKLLENGACYRAEDGAVMYRSSQYSQKYGSANKKKTEDGWQDEDKDEVLVRSNGIPTYFAADIAYHYNKFAVRGFDLAIDVWGADHHGHVARMKGAMDAIGLDGSKLDVVLMQLVQLMREGKPVRMSKRTGKAITLATLLDEVPLDSARFFFNTREPGSPVEFDLDLAVAQDSDNPVYYVQYAHARICSILRNLAAEGVQPAGLEELHPELLTDAAELELLRHIGAFPTELVQAARLYDPARVTRYVVSLATLFHKFYNSCRVKGEAPDLMQARIALCMATKNTLCNALNLLKITVPDKM